MLYRGLQANGPHKKKKKKKKKKKGLGSDPIASFGIRKSIGPLIWRYGPPTAALRPKLMVPLVIRTHQPTGWIFIVYSPHPTVICSSQTGWGLLGFPSIFIFIGPANIVHRDIKPENIIRNIFRGGSIRFGAPRRGSATLELWKMGW